MTYGLIQNRNKFIHASIFPIHEIIAFAFQLASWIDQWLDYDDFNNLDDVYGFVDTFMDNTNENIFNINNLNFNVNVITTKDNKVVDIINISSVHPSIPLNSINMNYLHSISKLNDNTYIIISRDDGVHLNANININANPNAIPLPNIAIDDLIQLIYNDNITNKYDNIIVNNNTNTNTSTMNNTNTSTINNTNTNVSNSITTTIESITESHSQSSKAYYSNERLRKNINTIYNIGLEESFKEISSLNDDEDDDFN